MPHKLKTFIDGDSKVECSCGWSIVGEMTVNRAKGYYKRHAYMDFCAKWRKKETEGSIPPSFTQWLKNHSKTN